MSSIQTINLMTPENVIWGNNPSDKINATCVISQPYVISYYSKYDEDNGDDEHELLVKKDNDIVVCFSYDDNNHSRNNIIGIDFVNDVNNTHIFLEDRYVISGLTRIAKDLHFQPNILVNKYMQIGDQRFPVSSTIENILNTFTIEELAMLPYESCVEYNMNGSKRLFSLPSLRLHYLEPMYTANNSSIFEWPEAYNTDMTTYTPSYIGLELKQKYNHYYYVLQNSGLCEVNGYHVVLVSPKRITY